MVTLPDEDPTMRDVIAAEPGGPECGCELLAIVGDQDLLLVPHPAGDAFLGYLGDLLGRRDRAGARRRPGGGRAPRPRR
jgi:hypothetical protein